MIKKNVELKLFILPIQIIFTCWITNVAAQDSIYYAERPIFVHASLLYDFPKSYGLTAGIHVPYRSIEKERLSKDGKRLIKLKDRYWGVDAGFYRYPFNYTGMLLVPFIGVRHYFSNTFFYETSIGAGLLRTFYDGKVYEVNANGIVKEKLLFGRWYAVNSLAWSFNFAVQKAGNKMMAIQIKPLLWFQYPFESFIKPHLSFEAGLVYDFRKRTTRSRKTFKHARV